MAISPADVFDAFPPARTSLRRAPARRAGSKKPTTSTEVHRRVMEIAGEPLPYGIAPTNRNVIDASSGKR